MKRVNLLLCIFLTILSLGLILHFLDKTIKEPLGGRGYSGGGQRGYSGGGRGFERGFGQGGFERGFGQGGFERGYPGGGQRGYSGGGGFERGYSGGGGGRGDSRNFQNRF